MKEKNKKFGFLETDESGKLKTQKADKKNHGFGTENIRQVVERNQGYMNCQAEDNWFSIEIVL